MSKIVINSFIKSNTTNEAISNKKVIKKGNIISFYHDGVNNKIEIKDEKVKLTRDSKESLIILEFEKNKIIGGIYKVKELNINMNIKTVTKDLVMKENGFKIEYDLFINDVYSDSFIYEFDWRC